ncbi:hypothetical protein KRX52_04270 [Pseudomonas sp. MAP12]|uniref:Uncharacterized protein n=1 Tax=Geopseudomonas aromaticivorans TaxID=2849492 RepID=A0ABS6MT72_9GAMM|nr:hypothetical protein [Pseudomonas aromaticivorans]MBV2132013.1 hypothetical protein [Pseudomonas aromaticivorans]
MRKQAQAQVARNSAQQDQTIPGSRFNEAAAAGTHWRQAMLKKIKAAIARRRKNSAASSAPTPRSTSRPDDASCPLNPLNPVGIHSPLHPINLAAHVSEPEPARRCDDSHRSSWGSSDSGGYSSSDSSWSSSDSSSSSSSSSSCD